MRILAVDDDLIILDLIHSAFSDVPSVNVTTASSAAEALNLISARRVRFDCLLLDIEMPEMDGLTLCRQIRSLSGYLYTPILMLTQRTDAVSVGRAFVAGATDYITKPFEVSDLNARLRVAERMMKRTEPALCVTAKELQKTGLPGVHQFEAHQPLHIEHIPQLVLPFSLGAYLSQLSRDSLDDCHVFAASIENFQHLYANGCTADLVKTIVAATKILAQSISCPELLMSHHGSGTFLCVVTTAQLPKWHLIEYSIKTRLQDLELRDVNGNQLQISLSVGQPIQPNANHTQRVKQTFDRAIRRVERQPNRKGSHVAR